MGFDFPRFFPVGEQDIPVPLVFGKHIMGIGSGTYRTACLFPDFDDFPVQVLQVLFRIHIAEFIFIDKEFIISQRLHFQVVIKFSFFNKLFIAFPRQNGAEKFTHHAGGTVNQSLMVFFQNGFGNERALSIKFQMGQGNHAVQIPKACNVFGQDNDMVVLLAVRIRIFRDFINHVPFHAVNHLLVIFLRQVLNLGKCLNHAVVRNSYGRMMPFSSGLNDFFIINEAIQTHFGMKMEFHPGRGISILMVNDLGFPFFHLLQFQSQTAGVLVKAYVASHLHHSAWFQ